LKLGIPQRVNIFIRYSYEACYSLHNIRLYSIGKNMTRIILSSENLLSSVNSLVAFTLPCCVKLRELSTLKADERLFPM